MIARFAANRKYVINMLNDRDFVMAQSCSLLSGTILSPPMLASYL
jgi:hypothetical protein